MGLRILSSGFEWMKQAACQGEAEKFFGTKSLLPARKICASCPVQFECEDYGQSLLDIPSPINTGLWGGKTVAELQFKTEQDMLALRGGAYAMCAWPECEVPIPRGTRGKPRLYCSKSCKKKAENARSKANVAS